MAAATACAVFSWCQRDHSNDQDWADAAHADPWRSHTFDIIEGAGPFVCVDETLTADGAKFGPLVLIAGESLDDVLEPRRALEALQQMRANIDQAMAILRASPRQPSERSR